jgi:hypothetical protein
MRLRLNGWQRIGVFLSVVWALSVGALGSLEYAQNGNPTHYFVETVKVPVPEPKNMNRPGGTFSLEEFLGYRAEYHFSFGRLIAGMLVPIAVLWCIAYIGVLVVRWVAAGFKKNGA